MILIPSYRVAYLTDKIVYVVPTLAAAGIFTSTIETSDVNRLIDEGGDGHGHGHASDFALDGS
ncbi:hypothetical protein [uncultured Aliiroseovarius sp.]|uniref:hypothetical protein n=1 Tax=uncultured Aliiroseovarius sp. TaxID=1658783 RepID=UPI00259A75A0|nr:hypothetical protein [uncultured Aliiroseovarius sp.]